MRQSTSIARQLHPPQARKNIEKPLDLDDWLIGFCLGLAANIANLRYAPSSSLEMLGIPPRSNKNTHDSSSVDLQQESSSPFQSHFFSLFGSEVVSLVIEMEKKKCHAAPPAASVVAGSISWKVP